MTSPRFAVGRRVLCRTESGWVSGTVVAHCYREPHWPEGMSVPYQVQLDGGSLIFAPADDDSLIRASATLSDAELDDLLESVSEQMPEAVRTLPREDRIAWLQRTLHAIHRNGDDEAGALDAEDEAATERAHKLYREGVRARYPRLHPRLFEVSALEGFVHAALRVAIESGDDDQLQRLLTQESRGIFSLELLTAEYCALLLEECEHFEAWCIASDVEVKRPNTMNNYGAILDDFGMEEVMQALMVRYVQPLARVLGFADVTGGEELATHHAFVVAYSIQKVVKEASSSGVKVSSGRHKCVWRTVPKRQAKSDK